MAKAIWTRYPNAHAQHVRTVDTVGVTVDEQGIVRVERILGIFQNAPRWALKLLGGDQETYVRELTFFVPPTADRPAPRVLQASVNLSLAGVITCHESITYRPEPSAPTAATVLHQRADFRAQGRIARGATLAAVGRRLESASVDRFASNAAIGRRGFRSVLSELYGDGRPGDGLPAFATGTG